MRPPSNTIPIGLTISRPAPSPMITNGNTAAADATATVNVGASRSLAPRRTSSTPKAWAPSSRSCWKRSISMTLLRAAMPSSARSEERRVGKECRSRCDWSSDVCSSDLAPDEFDAKGLGPVEPELLEAIDQHDTVAGGDAQQREKRDKRAERQRGAVDKRRQHSANKGHRQGKEGQTRQVPAPEYGLKEQEDGDHGSEAEANDPHQIDLLARRSLPDHLSVVFEWELGVRQAIFDVRGHGAQAAAADVGFDVDVALSGVTLDDGRRGLDAHIGHLV